MTVGSLFSGIGGLDTNPYSWYNCTTNKEASCQARDGGGTKRTRS